MTEFISKDSWLNTLHGWTITDCAVRTSDVVYLVARQDIPYEQVSGMWDNEIPTRFIVIYLDDNPKGELGWQECGGFNKPLCGVARKPLSQGLLAERHGMDGDVLVVGGGSEGNMEQIAPNNGPMTTKLKCIDGYAYSVGTDRAIYKRANLGCWVKLDDGLPKIDNHLSDNAYLDLSLSQGFEDIDGFSESDMYAVGGKGDIWHYDSTAWMQEGFPSNMQLNTVTCAGDGYVYVSGQGGTLWRGRNSTWEHLYDGSYTIPWNDVLWFEDKLWLASDYMLRIWNGKELVPVTDDQGQELPFSGHMDAYDGLLVIADSDSVMAYQNGKWRALVAPYEDVE